MPNWNIQNLGSFLSLPAHGRAGARATSSLAAHFAKRNTKFGGGGTPVAERFAFATGQEARAGKNSFPPNPLPFCPPELKSFSKFSVRIFAKKSSDFVQRSEPDRTLFELETEAVGAGNATDSQVGVVVEFG